MSSPEPQCGALNEADAIDDLNTRKSLMDNFFHRFRRAKTPKVQDYEGHFSAGGSALPPSSQPNISFDARRSQAKLKVPESQEQVGLLPRVDFGGTQKRNELPLRVEGVDEPASVSPIASAPVAFQGISLDLWNRAYESLMTKDAHLVETYEIILSEQMTIGSMLNALSFAPSAAPPRRLARPCRVSRRIAVSIFNYQNTFLVGEISTASPCKRGRSCSLCKKWALEY